MVSRIAAAIANLSHRGGSVAAWCQRRIGVSRGFRILVPDGPDFQRVEKGRPPIRCKS